MVGGLHGWDSMGVSVFHGVVKVILIFVVSLILILIFVVSLFNLVDHKVIFGVVAIPQGVRTPTVSRQHGNASVDSTPERWLQLDSG